MTYRQKGLLVGAVFVIAVWGGAAVLALVFA